MKKLLVPFLLLVSLCSFASDSHYSPVTWEGSYLKLFPTGGIKLSNGTVITNAQLSTIGAASGADTALSNLAAVAINTSLLPGADGAINLGSGSFQWLNGYFSGTVGASSFNGNLTRPDDAGLPIEIYPGTQTSGNGNESVVYGGDCTEVGCTGGNGSVYGGASEANSPGSVIVQGGSPTQEGAVTIAGRLAQVNTTSGLSVLGSGTFTLNSATANTVPYFNGSKVLTSSAVTPTELGYLSGVTSAIQTQINGKLSGSGTEGYLLKLSGGALVDAMPSDQVVRLDGTLPPAGGAANIVYLNDATTPGSGVASTVLDFQNEDDGSTATPATVKFTARTGAGGSTYSIFSFYNSSVSEHVGAFVGRNTAVGNHSFWARGLGICGADIGDGSGGSVCASTATAKITPAGAISGASLSVTGTIGASNFSGSHSGTSSGTNTGDQDLSNYVQGPASSVANGFVAYDGTSGKLIKSISFLAEEQSPGNSATLAIYGQDNDVNDASLGRSLYLSGGYKSTGTGHGGTTTVTAGDSEGGNGGLLNLFGGVATTGTGGNIVIRSPIGGAGRGDVTVESADWSVNASGTATFSNFSGSSSGTNTGDQDLSGYQLISKLVAYDSNASAGGNATESLTVTGLGATDTILAVSQKTAGANSTPIIAYGSPGSNSLSVTWTADPGAGAVVKVLVRKP